MNNNNKLYIELLTDTARIPTVAHAGDAGMDFYADEDITLAPGDVAVISTGIKMAIPTGYYLDLRPRSGISKNFPNYIANAPGTIDSTYRGEIKVMVVNNSRNDYLKIVKGFKICQGIVLEYNYFNLKIVDTLDDTDRGSDGFGSSGYYATELDIYSINNNEVN